MLFILMLLIYLIILIFNIIVIYNIALILNQFISKLKITTNNKKKYEISDSSKQPLNHLFIL